jgi:hypothetical protein
MDEIATLATNKNSTKKKKKNKHWDGEKEKRVAGSPLLLRRATRSSNVYRQSFRV